jgi:Ser/Thr protein kinase RdoA (MazF antagonist)
MFVATVQSMSDKPPQYDDATLADLGEMVATIAARYGYSKSADITLLNVSENATYLIQERHNSTRSILRVHRVGYHTRAGIESELEWLAALRRDNVAEVIHPIADHDGAIIQTINSRRGGPERFAVMFAFMEGKEPSPNDDLAPWFEILGALTAKLHSHAKSWTKPPRFSRQVWDWDAMHGRRHLWGPWQAAIGLDSDGHDLLNRATAKVRSRLVDFGQTPARFGLIHADLRLANLLVDGERLKLLDFDDCGFSWFMYDFASAISFFEHLPSVAILRDSWLRGYATVAPVTREEREIIPTVVIARRILLLAWIASHSEVPTARELGGAYTEQSLELAYSYLHDRLLAD